MRERINQAMTARLDDENGDVLQLDEEGFTLVELLIVVVVLGILAAVTVFGLSGTTSTSYKSACNTDARSVEVAVEAYHTNNNPTWPTTLDQLTAPDPGGQTYLRTLPGNTTKYKITLGNAGQVLVNGNDYDAGVNGTGGAVNPCTQIP
jgi:prepilin-type N-terminal cleavage/methylation domain-containing protein